MVADLPIGAGCDAVKFDAGYLFASCREGVLNIAKETSGKFEMVGTLKTRVGAKTMALDHATHTIYLPTAEFGEATGGRRGRPRAKPESFMVLVVKPVQK